MIINNDVLFAAIEEEADTENALFSQGPGQKPSHNFVILAHRREYTE